MKAESITGSNRIVYIPTAAYAPDRSSTRSLGEQRRRARYDAKEKMSLLQTAFEAESCSLLELDKPGLSERDLAMSLGEADIIYIDGGFEPLTFVLLQQ